MLTGGSTCRIDRNGTGSAPDDQSRERAGAADLRFSHLGTVRPLILAGVSSVIRRLRRCGAGLFRRLDGSDLPAFHRDLDSDPGALSADHHRSIITPTFWVLLGILLLFSWVALVGRRRGARNSCARVNFENMFMCALRALGQSDGRGKEDEEEGKGKKKRKKKRNN